MLGLIPINHRRLRPQIDACIEASFPPLVFGEPGIGKTELFEEAARRRGMRFTVIHLNQLGPGDVHGLRFPDPATGTTCQYPPDFLPAPDDPPTLLLFDELCSAPELTRKPALELFLARKLGKYVLAPQHSMGAASNTGDDGVLTYPLDDASAERFCHFRLKANLNHWIPDYANPNRVDPRVIAYLKSHPGDFVTSRTEENDNISFPTPRGWTITSRLIRAAESLAAEDMSSSEILERHRPMIAGKVGNECADRFIAFAINCDTETAITDLLAAPRDHRPQLMPTTSGGMMRLAAAIPSVLDFENILPTARESILLAELMSNTEIDASEGAFHSRDFAAWAIHCTLNEAQRHPDTETLPRILADPELEDALAIVSMKPANDDDDDALDYLSQAAAAV